MDCPFCQLIASDDVTESNAHAVAFPDGFPVAAGHTLVLPRRHVASVFDLGPEEYAALWEVVRAVRRRLTAAPPSPSA
jgi:diadenosine tetraphosphate (Ap4A) HIT family hydrolase